LIQVKTRVAIIGQAVAAGYSQEAVLFSKAVEARPIPS
jgi:hypothetical protein